MVIEESSFGEVFGARRHLFALLIGVVPLQGHSCCNSPSIQLGFPKNDPPEVKFSPRVQFIFPGHLMWLTPRSHTHARFVLPEPIGSREKICLTADGKSQ